MRITGGTWRSRQLRGPGRGLALRPTPDALRERGFAVLGDRIAGERFLDLYAGTGAVGFEALSRGALQAVFVERNKHALELIEANLSALQVDQNRARVVKRPVLSAIARLALEDQRFGVAWADPPFESWSEGLEAVASTFETGILRPDGIACLECPDRADVEGQLPAALRIDRDLRGGASRLVMIVRG